MKLKEFAENINKLLEEHPETFDFDVVTSADNEGNEFNPVYFSPAVGYYNEKEWAFNQECEDKEEHNAVRVN